jgi:hypothetical protein
MREQIALKTKQNKTLLDVKGKEIQAKIVTYNFSD